MTDIEEKTGGETTENIGGSVKVNTEKKHWGRDWKRENEEEIAADLQIVGKKEGWSKKIIATEAEEEPEGEIHEELCVGELQ